MFSDTGNAPAKLIKEFRKKNDKPILRALPSKNQSILEKINWNVKLILNLKMNLLVKSLDYFNHLLKMLFQLKSGKIYNRRLVKTLSEKELIKRF